MYHYNSSYISDFTHMVWFKVHFWASFISLLFQGTDDLRDAVSQFVVLNFIFVLINQESFECHLSNFPCMFSASFVSSASFQFIWGEEKK